MHPAELCRRNQLLQIGRDRLDIAQRLECGFADVRVLCLKQKLLKNFDRLQFTLPVVGLCRL